jgi:hypothetical protein
MSVNQVRMICVIENAGFILLALGVVSCIERNCFTRNSSKDPIREFEVVL